MKLKTVWSIANGYQKIQIKLLKRLAIMLQNQRIGSRSYYQHLGTKDHYFPQFNKMGWCKKQVQHPITYDGNCQKDVGCTHQHCQFAENFTHYQNSQLHNKEEPNNNNGKPALS